MAFRREYDVRNRTVFISGGSRGLGLELARVFGQRGARIAISARDPAELERARANLAAAGVTAFTIAADMRQRAESERALQTAQAKLGPIDVLVNNLGTISVGPLDAFTEDDYRDAMETHFWAPFYAIETLKPAMRARRDGRIVNVASIGGRVSVPHLLPYSASKFALVGYSEGLRAELLRDGVYVTTVIPGLDAHRQSGESVVQGTEPAGIRVVQHLDSLPFLSVDVREAAQAIVDATQRGAADVTISLPARIAQLVHGTLPGPVTELLALVARVLPPPGGIGRSARRGAR